MLVTCMGTCNTCCMGHATGAQLTSRTAYAARTTPCMCLPSLTNCMATLGKCGALFCAAKMHTCMQVCMGAWRTLGKRPAEL